MPRSVQLSDDAYALLKALKRERESFSDVVKRLASERKDPRKLKELKGWGEGLGIEWEEFDRRMREADDKRFGSLFQERD